MKICFWTTRIFALGGTRKIVTMLANELSKEHDVYILTGGSRKKEKRELYGMNDDVNVIFYDSQEFSRDIRAPKKLKNKLIRAANDKLGIMNSKSMTERFEEILYPKERQEAFAEYLESFDFDVIVATATLAMYLAIIAPKLRAKTIGWQHSSYESYFGTKNLLFWKKEEIAKRYFPNLDRYVVLSMYDVKKFKDNLGLDVLDINNPVTITSPERSPLDSKNFLVAARFEEAKGVDMALQAFREFSLRNSEWNLVIAGDGTLRNELLEYVWDNKLVDRVRFLGQVSDMPSCYRQSSIYLMTSRWEGWGLVVTEAFSMGVPVIAFDIPPMDLIIDNGINGFIVSGNGPFDIKSYAKTMLELAEDEELRKRMGEAAFEKSKQYGMDRYVEKWNTMLQDICANDKED